MMKGTHTVAAASVAAVLGMVAGTNADTQPVTATSTTITESILYSFKGYAAGGSDGIGPNGVIQASDGNFYGTTDNGGADKDTDDTCGAAGVGDGTLFRVTPSGAETILYSFSCGVSGATVGGIPSAGLILGKDGDLYGSSDGGAAYGVAGVPGSVFKFTLAGVETVLHAFPQPEGISSDGETPNALVLASDGDFYGTTQTGGTAGVGTVFKITPSGDEKVLHTFTAGVSGSKDGGVPRAALIQANDGNLYGTTYGGGAHGVGTVYKITPSGAESIVYSFSGGVGGSKDGASPAAALIQGSDGNLYGTTFFGGNSSTGVGTGVGTVYQLTLAGVEKVIYSFAPTKDGQFPSKLILGADGNFYGVTLFGGGSATAQATGGGTVYRLTAAGAETILHSFTGALATSGPDGGGPVDLLQGADGDFYGATAYGGAYSYGTIFKLSVGPSATATPAFSPPAGSYGSAQDVSITDATAGSAIYYTTNGSTPTTASTKYAGPVKVSTTETIKALAVAAGHSNSAVASAAYTIAATVSISPTSLTFPSTAAGSSSAAQVVTVRNPGSTALALSSIAVVGGQADDYVLTKNCGSSLAAGATCTLSVTFKPVSAGVKLANISIVDNAAGSPQSVALTGTGTAAGATPVVKLSAASLTFASQAAGTSSAAQTVTLSNSGTASLSLSSVTVTGGQADDFALAKTCGSSLAAGASCSLSVTFKPVSAGTKVASITVIDNAAGSPQSVALKGTGTAAGAAPAVKLSASSLTFASQAAGTSSAAQTVTLSNSGTASLSLSSITVTGGQADDFALAKTCGSSLAAGASCSLSVTFKPVSAGKKLASISIADNAGGSPQTVALTGTGI